MAAVVMVDGDGASRHGLPESSSALAFPIGGPTSSSWREHVLTRAAELQTLTFWVLRCSPAPGTEDLTDAILGHLDTARRAADDRPGLRAWVAGSRVERAMTNLDAAEANLLRLAHPEYLRGQMPGLLAHVRHHLPSGDPRRVAMEELTVLAAKRDLSGFEHDAVVAALRGASTEARREIMRVRSFRNVLLVAAAALTVAAIAVGIFGAARPDTLALCFNPDLKVVCPTGETALQAVPEDLDEVVAATTNRWDVPLVEIVGLVAAAVAAAAALRGIRGTSTPYSLPVALAVLKLPTGALTAVLGLLLMRGQFVPGLSALDTSAQVLAWAVVFGYAQQVFTRLVDRQAHAVLDDVGGSVGKASTG